VPQHFTIVGVHDCKIVKCDLEESTGKLIDWCLTAHQHRKFIGKTLMTDSSLNSTYQIVNITFHRDSQIHSVMILFASVLNITSIQIGYLEGNQLRILKIANDKKCTHTSYTIIHNTYENTKWHATTSLSTWELTCLIIKFAPLQTPSKTPHLSPSSLLEDSHIYTL